VATRFHNLLLAILLHRQVLSISYNKKNDALMAEVGLGDYCQSIDDLDVDTLVEQFQEAEKRAATLAPRIRQRCDDYRAALRNQYLRVFNLYGVSRN